MLFVSEIEGIVFYLYDLVGKMFLADFTVVFGWWKNSFIDKRLGIKIMYLQKIHIKNFRLLEDVDLLLVPISIPPVRLVDGNNRCLLV